MSLPERFSKMFCIIYCATVVVSCYMGLHGFTAECFKQRSFKQTLWFKKHCQNVGMTLHREDFGLSWLETRFEDCLNSALPLPTLNWIAFLRRWLFPLEGLQMLEFCHIVIFDKASWKVPVYEIIQFAIYENQIMSLAQSAYRLDNI